MDIYTYRISLRESPLSISVRKGVIIQTEYGWGEVAPLPGFSIETLGEAICSLECSILTPAAFFGLECAKKPFPSAFPPIRIAALVSSWQEAVRAIESGFTTIKLKVKHLSVEQAILLVKKIQKFPIQLRIDANRTWDFAQTLQFFETIDPSRIEYIEEPCRHPTDLWKLSSYPLPIALDETLLDSDMELLFTCPAITAFVLKPTLLGRRLETLIQKGKNLNKKLIFSSCFESAVGLLHIAHLQASFAPELAAGLDTFNFFIGNLLPLSIINGTLSNAPLPTLDQQWFSAH